MWAGLIIPILLIKIPRLEIEFTSHDGMSSGGQSRNFNTHGSEPTSVLQQGRGPLNQDTSIFLWSTTTAQKILNPKKKALTTSEFQSLIIDMLSVMK